LRAYVRFHRAAGDIAAFRLRACPLSSACRPSVLCASGIIKRCAIYTFSDKPIKKRASICLRACPLLSACRPNVLCTSGIIKRYAIYTFSDKPIKKRASICLRACPLLSACRPNVLYTLGIIKRCVICTFPNKPIKKGASKCLLLFIKSDYNLEAVCHSCRTGKARFRIALRLLHRIRSYES